jgi:hypothetical protein
MYWEIGITIGNEQGSVNVHPAALQEGNRMCAIEHAIDMAQALYPNQRIELNYVKEYDNA